MPNIKSQPRFQAVARQPSGMNHLYACSSDQQEQSKNRKYISSNINTNVDIDKASRNLNHKRRVYV